MKIAVWHNLPSGGGKRALYHHVKGLLARGHQIEVWCPPTADRKYLPLADLIPEHIVAYERPEAADPPKPMGRRRQWRAEFTALDAHCHRCAQEIDAGGFDVLLAGNCQDSAVAPIGRHVSLSSVFYHQEPKRLLYEARPELPWVASPDPTAGILSPRRWKDALRDFDVIQSLRLDAREERASVAAFTTLLVNSSFSRETILRTYGLPARVCYLGIDPAMFCPGTWPREPYVVGVGGIQGHKGIETAIEAVAAIPVPQRPPLVWIGNMASPGYAEILQGLATQLGVTLTIQSLVTDVQLVEALGRATAMIYAPHLEPFGFAPLEANACGTPVVAVAEGGVRETIVHGENGLLVPNRDPIALGREMTRLLENQDLAKKLGGAGAATVRDRWTWDAAVERLEGHLLAVAQRN